MQNNDRPLVECHRSSKIDFEATVFCEDQAKHPLFLPFFGFLTAQE